MKLVLMLMVLVLTLMMLVLTLMLLVLTRVCVITLVERMGRDARQLLARADDQL